MRHLIALFACSLVMATASASDPAPTPAKPALDARSATVKAILEGKPAAIKPSVKPDIQALAAAADAATLAAATPAAAKAPAPAAASEDEVEVDLSVRIAERLAELRAQQQARAAKAAVAKRAAEARRRKEAEAAIAVAAKPKNGTHWSYEGEYGPANWSSINTAWAKCGSGNRQSPIDIRDGIRVDLEQIAFEYRPSGFSVTDNGHTVQVAVGSGNFLSVGGRTYELQQLHFHRPAEERVNGKTYEMGIHLVHKDIQGRTAVLALMLQRGRAQPAVQTVWNNLPLERQDTATPSIVFNPNDLLPERRDYYTYMGSLSEPPCTEGVLWRVMKEPLQASAEQMAVFSRLYPLNARPVQAAAGRMVKESQ